ncbi:HET-domain-containing protein [Pseudovirgaria hyperparasitica]|uniref:HET-domain-containing protein n=1 Tax=Pseudovirgaria hyperparasitica TaxID=470096 RepID=A0A6A6WFU4_9PEZI|nr:HET-domain-containing protein [Pseudovirgaria hyperparasitica]KAF2760786.1 HET-domain-containing protein [Pseudovirgaria hyperparasitica]
MAIQSLSQTSSEHSAPIGVQEIYDLANLPPLPESPRDSQAYAYTPLIDSILEIRLINILPGREDDPLEVEICTTPLISANLPKYEALSYAWGSPEKTETIYLRNKTCFDYDVHHPGYGKPGCCVPATPYDILGVTSNLGSALRHLRYIDAPRVMWIDAICINQEDNLEKSDQVYSMADVFHKATRCIVWLGPEADDSSHAMHLLDTIGRRGNDFGRPVAEDDVNSSSTDHDPERPLTERGLRSILSITSRTWFSRLWTRQEIVHSSDESIVQCGWDHLLWGRLRNAFTPLYQNLRLCWLPPIKDLDEIVFSIFKNLMATPKKEVRFMNAMMAASTSHCVDPRDRVFAMISFNHEIRLRIKPDYSRTVLSVYTDLLLHMIDIGGSLNVLSHCGVALRPYGFPTWVRDWRVASPQEGLIFSWAGHWASAGTAAEVEYDKLKRKLSSRGLILQSIVHVWPSSTDSKNLASQECPDLRRDTPSQSPTPLVYNPFSIPSIVPPDERFDLPGMGRAQKDKLIRKLVGSPSKGCNSFRIVELLLEERCNTKRVEFMAEDGSHGIGPADTLSGDIVASFLGASVLFVLRPVSASSDYQLVGECCLHGYMYGEALFGRPLRPWLPAMLGRDADNRGPKRAYMDSITNNAQFADPRLPNILHSELSAEERASIQPDGTGFTPNLLRKIGVPLRTINLV